MTRARLLGIYVVTLCVLRAPTVRAERDAAKPHLDAAAAAYAAGKYDEAAGELERAYALDPVPALLYARAQALRLGGRCRDAIALYREYLATTPNEQQTEAARTGLAACVQSVEAETPDPISAGEQPRMQTPPPSSPPPPPEEQTPTRDTPRWYSDRIGGALAIGGTVAIGLGIGFVIASSHSRDDARDAELRIDAVRHLDDATLERRIGITAIAAGIALVSGGVVRYLSIRHDAGPIAISVTPTEVVVLGRF